MGVPGGESTLLTVTDPWQGADSVSASLLIARNGEDVPDGFDGQVIRGEAKRVVAMSSTFVAMLDEMDMADRIVGVSGLGFISTPSVAARKESVVDVGYEANVDYEKLVALDADIVLLYGVNGASVMEPKLRELGIPFIYIGDYLEESPVGKVEWMVALGEIVGARDRAAARFGEIRADYEALAASVDRNGAGVKTMINAPYGDSWFMPSPQSYMSHLIHDAGGVPVYQSNHSTASATIGMEEAYLLADEADVWLNPGMVSTNDEMKATLPRFMDVKPVREGRVYNNTRRMTAGGGNDFYESGAVRPDLILRDLIMVLGGDADEDSLTYYFRVK